MPAPVRKDSPPDFHSKELNVYAIMGLVFCFVFPPLAFIFSIIGLSQIRKDKTQDGKSIAMAGLIFSIVEMVFILLFLIAILLINSSV